MRIQLFILTFLIVTVTSCTAVSKNEAPQQSYSSAEVMNKTWQWEATVTPVERISVVGPERYTIRFAGAGKLNAKFDCNSGGGSYTLTEGTVTFGPLLATRRACPEGSQDAVFMRDLQRSNSFFLQDGQLFLGLPFDSGTMRFRAMP